MGYCIYLGDTQFTMPSEKKEAALQALKDMWAPGNEANMTGGSYGGGQKEQHWYAWMNNSDIENASTFEEAMEEWRYPVTTDGEGNVVDIAFDGEKLGDEVQMFRAIAPFVDDGSYIEVVGEDGEHWRWFFTHQLGEAHCEEQYGKVVYE